MAVAPRHHDELAIQVTELSVEVKALSGAIASLTGHVDRLRDNSGKATPWYNVVAIVLAVLASVGGAYYSLNAKIDVVQHDNRTQFEALRQSNVESAMDRAQLRKEAELRGK